MPCIGLTLSARDGPRLTIRWVAREPTTVPVLLITGPVGVGKTRTASAASGLLTERGIRHACVDLPQISKAFPERDDDPWNEQLAHRNLACMWVNFRAVGAERLIISRVLEARSLISHITDAVPGTDVVVVRLRAPLDVVEARIRDRNRSHPNGSSMPPPISCRQWKSNPSRII